MNELTSPSHRTKESNINSMPTYIGLRLMPKIPLVTSDVVLLGDCGFTVVSCWMKLITAGIRNASPAIVPTITNQLGELKLIIDKYSVRILANTKQIANCARGGIFIFIAFQILLWPIIIPIVAIGSRGNIDVMNWLSFEANGSEDSNYSSWTDGFDWPLRAFWMQSTALYQGWFEPTFIHLPFTRSRLFVWTHKKSFGVELAPWKTMPRRARQCGSAPSKSAKTNSKIATFRARSKVPF